MAPLFLFIPVCFNCIRLLKGSRGGPELKDLAKTLLEAGVGDGAFVQVQRGTPLLPHQFRINVFVDTSSLVNPTLPQASGEGDAPNGGAAEELGTPVQFLGELIVTADEAVGALKRRVFHDLVLPMGTSSTSSIAPSSIAPILSTLLDQLHISTVNIPTTTTTSKGDGEVVAATDSTSALPIRLRMTDRSEAVGGDAEAAPLTLGAPLRLRLRGVFRDASSLLQALKGVRGGGAGAALADNMSVVAQLGRECVGEITDDHLLLTGVCTYLCVYIFVCVRVCVCAYLCVRACSVI